MGVCRCFVINEPDIQGLEQRSSKKKMDFCLFVLFKDHFGQFFSYLPVGLSVVEGLCVPAGIVGITCGDF